jgi:hypothetical protein
MFFSLFAFGACIGGIHSQKPRPSIEQNKVERKCTKTLKVTDTSVSWQNVLANTGNSLAQLKELNTHISTAQWNSNPYGLTIEYYVTCPTLSYIDYYNSKMAENYGSIVLSMCYMADLRPGQEAKCQSLINSAISNRYVDKYGVGVYKKALATHFGLSEISKPSKWTSDSDYQLCYRSSLLSFNADHYVVNTRSYGTIDPCGLEDGLFSSTSCVWLTNE